MRSGRSVGWGLALLGLVVGAGSARAEEWVELGTRRVAEGAERDAIPVAAAQAGTGRFDAIKLEVQERGIELLDLEVHFGNGERQDVAVRAQFRPGESTRVIDLERSDRVIERVVLVYRARGRRDGAPIVRVLGRRAGAAAPAERWEDLGERVVDFGAERDTIPVTAREGRFRRIRLEVEGNAIEVIDLRVTFGNGDEQDVQVRERIAAGGSTRAIDLPGEARVIRSVRLRYKTEGRDARGRATVRLFGAD